MHKWLIFCIFVVYKNIKIVRPLEQVRLLVSNAIRSIKSVNASFVSFFIETMTLVLTIKGRINFLQFAGYGKSCKSRFRQNFRKPFDWLAFNMGLIKQQSGHLYAIAIDYSIGKVKLLLHNAMMIERFISTFGKMTEHTRNKPPVFDDKNKLFKDLLFLGINDAA